MKLYRKNSIKSSTTVRYETPQGKSGVLELDFDNPSSLFNLLEEVMGYDFALQFQDEYEAWYNENVATLLEVVEDRTKTIFESGDECSGSLSELRDVLNSIDEYATDVLDEDDTLLGYVGQALTTLEEAEDSISDTLGEVNDLREDLGQEGLY